MNRNTGGNISLLEAMGMIDQRNVILIDVKSREEYAKFHLRKSINVPIENFKDSVHKVIKGKNKKIILYCSSGIRSMAAYEMLKDMGYRYVYNIYEGVNK